MPLVRTPILSALIASRVAVRVLSLHPNQPHPIRPRLTPQHPRIRLRPHTIQPPTLIPQNLLRQHSHTIKLHPPTSMRRRRNHIQKDTKPCSDQGAYPKTVLHARNQRSAVEQFVDHRHGVARRRRPAADHRSPTFPLQRRPGTHRILIGGYRVVKQVVPRQHNTP